MTWQIQLSLNGKAMSTLFGILKTRGHSQQASNAREISLLRWGDEKLGEGTRGASSRPATMTSYSQCAGLCCVPLANQQLGDGLVQLNTVRSPPLTVCTPSGLPFLLVARLRRWNSVPPPTDPRFHLLLQRENRTRNRWSRQIHWWRSGSFALASSDSTNRIEYTCSVIRGKKPGQQGTGILITSLPWSEHGSDWPGS
ncbi:hypothetical protein VTK26DRAFT_8140 [Humicola hyalothermophila]